MVLSCNLIVLLTPTVLISSLTAAASIVMMEVMTQPLLGLDVPARCNTSHVTPCHSVRYLRLVVTILAGTGDTPRLGTVTTSQ